METYLIHESNQSRLEKKLATIEKNAIRMTSVFTTR